MTRQWVVGLGCWLRLAGLVLASALMVPCLGTAHEGGHGEGEEPLRIWYKTDGTYVFGSYVRASERELKILSSKGKVLTIPLAELNPKSQAWVVEKKAAIAKMHQVREEPAFYWISIKGDGMATGSKDDRPEMAEAFKAFEGSVRLRWDAKHLLVESNGIPEHPMMVGICSWQQQVPLPQAYRGENAWRIPLHPVPAKTPVSAKGKFLRGAIALAVNGIPIFNPLNNRGDDAYLAGELDEYGGHCGRADDYHYHLAPVHLEKIVGKGSPIAYALDGYPIYGYQDPEGSDYAPLDKLNGHRDADGNYHYHATPEYPYVNGGFFGVVTEREGQVDPQPRAEPIRPALPPMKGATITRFSQADGRSELIYEVRNRSGSVVYTAKDDGRFEFVFTDPDGKVRKETYRSRNRPPEPRGPRGGEQRGGERGKGGDEAGRGVEGAKTEVPAGMMRLSSGSVDAQGFVAKDCTCDGKKETPAIAWEQVPEGTESFAISLWHTAPDQEKSYWLLYNIPADIRSLDQNMRGIGEMGLNDKKRQEYDPMCSKGPGVKTYHISVYALSKKLEVRSSEMDRQRLLREVKQWGLGESRLDFRYERKGRSEE